MIKLKSIALDPDWLPKSVNFIVSGLALILVGLSMTRPWYAVPQLSFPHGSDPSLPVFSSQDSLYTIYFKLALIGSTILFLIAVAIFRKKIKSVGALLVGFTLTCLVLTLWFPTWLTIGDSHAIGEGAWLQQQHDTMTWLGGDSYRAHAERSIDLGTGVNAQDPPARLAVYRPPTGSLGISRLNDWVWWFGYGPAFTQFVGKGWFYATGGYALGSVCILGFYWRRHITRARKLLKRLIIYLAAVITITTTISAAVVITCKRHLSQAEEATAQGDYFQARNSLKQAITTMPSLINDSGIIRQLGYYDSQLDDEPSQFAILYQISWFENEGYYSRARELVSQLSNQRNELPRPAARELSRHQLRIAINFINSGRYLIAKEHLDELLKHEPSSPQAHFHRQLIATQTGHLHSNRIHSSLLRNIYDGYKSKNKRSVIAASWWMLAQGELNAGNTQQAREARLKSQGK